MIATQPRSDLIDQDQTLVLPNVRWEQYVAVNDAFPDRRGLRMIYLDGSLTLLTVSRRHVWHADLLDELVKAVAFGCGIEWEIAGSATSRMEGLDAGDEGDRTYYLRAHAAIMSGPIDVDLATQPPPDLAIEVEVSHSANHAVATYARLGVPEVWRLDVRRETLLFLHRRDDGTYEPAPRSKNLPMLGPDDVLAQLRLAEDLGSKSRWRAQLAEWVRDSLLPRIGP